MRLRSSSSNGSFLRMALSILKTWVWCRKKIGNLWWCGRQRWFHRMCTKIWWSIKESIIFLVHMKLPEKIYSIKGYLGWLRYLVIVLMISFQRHFSTHKKVIKLKKKSKRVVAISFGFSNLVLQAKVRVFLWQILWTKCHQSKILWSLNTYPGLFL